MGSSNILTKEKPPRPEWPFYATLGTASLSLGFSWNAWIGAGFEPVITVFAGLAATFVFIAACAFIYNKLMSHFYAPQTQRQTIASVAKAQDQQQTQIDTVAQTAATLDKNIGVAEKQIATLEDGLAKLEAQRAQAAVVIQNAYRSHKKGKTQEQEVVDDNTIDSKLRL